MRKNTLIKLLAVFAMCFLICAAFVACGETEEPAEEAKVIAGVAFDAEGNLVITYNDNTTQKVALPVAATCEHTHIAKHTLVEHTAAANGKYLEVCDDCGYAWIKFEQRHNWLVYDTPLTVDPTCQSEGYTITSECETCGATSEKTNVIEAIDHVWDNGTYASNGNDCEDGGVMTYECTFGCGTTKTENVAANKNEGIDGQHTVTEWNLDSVVYGENDVVITGKCDDCGKEVSYTAPALKKDGSVNKTDYDVVLSERKNCREAIIGTFTLKADTTIVFENVVVEAAGVAHMLTSKVTGEREFVYQAGVACLEHNKTHEYSIAEYEGIKGFADKPIVSCDAILAYYECEECGAVCDVMAYSEHVYKVTATVEADCENDGYKTYTCEVCGDDYNETIKSEGHAYVYGDLYWSDDKDAYVCDVECSECDYEDVYAPEYTVAVEAATCVKDGSTVVTYKLHDGSTKTATFTEEKTGHHLNGQLMVARDENNKVIYAWTEGCGIYEFDKVSEDDTDRIINTDKAVVAYFTCDSCGHKVDVYAQIGFGVPVEPVTNVPGDEE